MDPINHCNHDKKSPQVWELMPLRQWISTMLKCPTEINKVSHFLLWYNWFGVDWADRHSLSLQDKSQNPCSDRRSTGCSCKVCDTAIAHVGHSDLQRWQTEYVTTYTYVNIMSVCRVKRGVIISCELFHFILFCLTILLQRILVGGFWKRM